MLPRVLAFFALIPSVLLAQTGRIAGVVTDAQGVPLRGAQVVLSAPGLAAESGQDGRFAISNVPVGRHRVRVLRLGYASSGDSVVDVRDAEEARIDVRLEAATIQLQGVVVTASRRAERLTEAPASITSLDVQVLESRAGKSYLSVLKEARGIEVTQVGIMSNWVNGRGFNTVLNSRWLTLEDGRIGKLPELGLPLNEHTTIPKIDVAGMEVLAGPGSALYGANASNGLLAVRTKDPRQYPGWMAELSGGSRDFADLQVRYAGGAGSWGLGRDLLAVAVVATNETHLLEQLRCQVGHEVVDGVLLADLRCEHTRAWVKGRNTLHSSGASDKP